MGEITNNHNLPEPLVEAVKVKRYDSGDSFVTATGLLKPPLIHLLTDIHQDEITEDAMDRIWSLLGQIMHDILEKNTTTGLSEERLFVDIAGYLVSGQFDHLSLRSSTLTDYKLTSAWSVIFGKDEWEQQLNILDWLLYTKGYRVDRLEICAVLRDWNRREAMRNQDYPQAQCVTIPIERWTLESQEKFIAKRLAMIVAAMEHGIVPECTEDERWATPTKYAVMKKGGKRAVKLFENEVDAQQMVSTDNKFYLETRPGENKRCEGYCAVSQWCPVIERLRSEQ